MVTDEPKCVILLSQRDLSRAFGDDRLDFFVLRLTRLAEHDADRRQCRDRRDERPCRAVLRWYRALLARRDALTGCLSQPTSVSSLRLQERETL